MDRRILLVDDEEDIGAALARLLQRDAYAILRAKNAGEGLALQAKHEAGVVISDRRMPEMTVVDFLTQVRELFVRPVPVDEMTLLLQSGEACLPHPYQLLAAASLAQAS